MSRLTPARALTLASLALAAALAGCGKTGELERPAPLFGRGAAAQTAQPDRDSDPSRPVRTLDPRNEALDPSPPRAVPIPGQGPDPMRPGPPGVLPDPYANPR